MSKRAKWYKVKAELYPHWSEMTNAERFKAIRHINKIVGYTL